MKYASVLAALLAAAFLALAAPCAAQPSSFSGYWVLNPNHSSWGQVRKPLMMFVEIDHKEPAIKYHGSITYADELSREFSFHGAIDGAEYPVDRSYGAGKISYTRLDARTIRSTYRSNDGQYKETAVTSVSRDGRRMTRKINLTIPGGTRAWTEAYDKR
jgi:hypothetical protein